MPARDRSSAASLPFLTSSRRHCANRRPTTKDGSCTITKSSPNVLAYRSTLPTRTALGSAAVVRTPMICCASRCPRIRICRSTLRMNLTRLPSPSTPGYAKRLAGKRRLPSTLSISHNYNCKPMRSINPGIALDSETALH